MVKRDSAIERVVDGIKEIERSIDVFITDVRADVFNKLSGTGNEQSQQFMDSDGLYTKNGQTTLGLAAIYKF
jgi:hypothetical protein